MTNLVSSQNQVGMIAVESFLDYLKNVKRYSPHTLTAYHEDLKQFSGYCATINDVRSLSEITPKIIRNWVVIKMSEGMTATTVKRKISTLRTYFKYAIREGLLENDPTEMVTMPKSGKKLPTYVQDYQMDSLLDSDLFEGGFPQLRDRLVLLTAYCTGMRRSELVGMKVGDVDFASKSIRITGKGSKQRLMPIAGELLEDMKCYLELRQEVAKTDHDVFFVTDKGLPVYDKFVYRLAQKYLKTCTTLSKRSPHVLRHTFATQLLNNGACIEAIRELLGHSDLSATQVYTHNSFDKLVKVFNKAHPRA